MVALPQNVLLVQGRNAGLSSGEAAWWRKRKASLGYYSAPLTAQKNIRKSLLKFNVILLSQK